MTSICYETSLDKTLPRSEERSLEKKSTEKKQRSLLSKYKEIGKISGARSLHTICSAKRCNLFKNKGTDFLEQTLG